MIRWAEGGGYADALSFNWDVFLFGARSGASRTNVNLSGLTDANDFSSPDGAWFSYAKPGLLWIQTDDGAYTDVTNCMMLAAVPGKIGDGAARTITNVDGATLRDGDDLRRASAAARKSCGASSSGPRNARSLASPRRRTARRSSSTSSIPASRLRPTSPPARSAATGRTAACRVRARRPS